MLDERTAHHEAGHAVLQFALGLGLKHITIVPDDAEGTAGASTHGGQYGVQARNVGEEDDDVANLRMFAEEAFLMRHCISGLAGAEAVRRLDPTLDDWRDGADDDYRQAYFRLDDLGLDDVSFTHLKAYVHARTTALVEYYWPEITTLAAELVVSRTISGEDARVLILRSLDDRKAILWRW